MGSGRWNVSPGMQKWEGREGCYALFLVTLDQWGHFGDLLALAHQVWLSGLSAVASTKAQMWSSKRRFLLRVKKMVFCWLNGLALT